jgi:hypothetical protein
MPEEEVETVEQEKVEVEKPPEVKPEIDLSAINSIKSDFENFKTETAAKLNDSAGKLNKIKEVFTGEDKETVNEKIFKEFAENPVETIEKYSQSKNASEIKELKNIIQENQLERDDSNVLAKIKTKDSDYDIVFAEMGKYVKDDDYKKYKNDPNRAEIFYSLAKSRMTADIEGKKVERAKANTIVKETVNKTANSEIPSSGGNSEETGDDLDRRIETVKETGNWSRGEEFTEKDADIFARFNRDAYGIKPK